MAGVREHCRQGALPLPFAHPGGELSPTSELNLMPHYRAFFTGLTGRIEAVHEFDCVTDAAAAEVARRVLTQRASGLAFELWRDSQRVHAEPRDRRT